MAEMTALEAALAAAWDFGDPAGSELRFRALLGGGSGAADPVDRAEILTQLARTFSLRRRFDEAHAMLDEAEVVLGTDAVDGPTAPEARVRCRLALERGRSWNSAGDKARAAEAFQRAVQLAEASAADFYLVDALHMMGIVAEGQASLDWNERAIARALASRSERTRSWLGALFNNTGMSYLEMQDYQRALDLFRQGQAWREAQDMRRGDGKTGRPTFIARWTVARALRGLGRHGEALDLLWQMAEDMAREGLSEDGYVAEELGENLLEIGRPDEARPHFAKAAVLLGGDPWFAEQEAARLARLRQLGGKVQ